MEFIQKYHLDKVLFYVSLVLISTHLIIYSMGVSGILRDNKSHSSVVLALDNTVQKPYVYRTLIPTLSKAITAVTPQILQQSAMDTIYAIKKKYRFKQFMEYSRWPDFDPRVSEPAYLFPVIVVCLLMYFSFIAYGVTLYRLALDFFPSYPRICYATPLFGLLALIPLIENSFKLYDPTSLLLSALCLLFLYRQNWVAYLITFMWGCLNKESIILYTGLFVVMYWQSMPRKKFALLLMIQCLVFLSIKTILNNLFIANTGNVVEFREIWVIASTISRFNGYNMMILIIGFWLVTAHWHVMPRILKQSLWIFAGCVAIYYLLGFPGEYRVFFESFPAFTMMAGYTLFRPLEKKLATA